MDDILTSATNVKQLEDRLKKLLTICRNRNMKLSPSKKLDAFLDFPTPSCKKDIQSIMGAVAHLKRWTRGLMLLSHNLKKLTGNSTPFFWNDDLQKELDRMKAALRQHIKLTPLDTSKDLLMWSDAAP